MKWLKILGIIIGVLILISIITTIIVDNKITAAHKSGGEEGRAQGYVVGYQEGGTTGFEKGKEEGYESGYKTGFEEGISTDYLVHNPTYKEIKRFLADDKTTSAWEINNNAEAKGMRAAYVSVSIPGGFHYTLVAFETVDKGLIFIDSFEESAHEVKHQEVKVEIGKRYSELNGLAVPDYDDTIIRITIIW